MSKNKAEYLYSRPGEKGLDIYYEYRGEVYSVVRAFTYPESEREQHQREQYKIDKKLDKKIVDQGKQLTLAEIFDCLLNEKEEEK